MSKTALSFLGSIILFAVLALAIFGFSVMSEPGHVMVGCFGTAPGKGCAVLSPTEHFAAHLSTFQSVSTGVVQAFSLPAVMLLLFLTAVAEDIDGSNTLRISALNRNDDFISPQRIQFNRWLSRREKRDPSLTYAMNR